MKISTLSYSTFTALSLLSLSLVACGGGGAQAGATGTRANGNSTSHVNDDDDADAGAQMTAGDDQRTTNDAPTDDEPADDEEVVADDEEPANDDEPAAEEAEVAVDGGVADEDTEGPTLVAKTPSSDTEPQRSDVTVSFQFSEPMDQASVEEAYNSLSMPKENISFEWNEAGDTVTLIPLEPFAYADGNAGGAYGYGFSIMETATDLAGNPLAEPASVSFSTLRRFVFQAELQSALTGWVNSNGAFGTDYIYVGDTAINNYTIYGLVGFSLAGFPAEYEEIEIADITFKQYSQGAGIADLGALYANQTFHDEVSQYALTADMLGQAMVSEAGYDEALDLTYRKVSVIDIVEDDLANREARTDLTRYRLMFDVPTDNDAKLDRVSLNVGPNLYITYLAE